MIFRFVSFRLAKESVVKAVLVISILRVLARARFEMMIMLPPRMMLEKLSYAVYREWESLLIPIPEMAFNLF